MTQRTPLPTVREHLESLPKPYRAEAIANTRHPYILKQRVASQAYALQIAFRWQDTDRLGQGQEYWLKVWRSIVEPKRSAS